MSLDLRRPYYVLSRTSLIAVVSHLDAQLRAGLHEQLIAQLVDRSWRKNRSCEYPYETDLRGHVVSRCKNRSCKHPCQTDLQGQLLATIIVGGIGASPNLTDSRRRF